MKALMIIRVSVQDPEKLKDYQGVAPSIIDQYEGKLLVRGGQVVTHEGEEESRRIVVIEFPSLEKAQAFYNSPEYTHAIKLREGAALFEMISVECIA